MQFGQAQPDFRDQLRQMWPIGSIYLSVLDIDPAISIGIGVWQAVGVGRVLVGQDEGDSDFNVLQENGGEKTVTLAETQIPAHTHTQTAHNHTQDTHTHTQNAHTHTQDAHTHTQNSHTHTQDPHSHVQRVNSAATGGLSGYTADTTTNTGVNSGYSTADATATCQGSTAVNQNATATNQNATAVNQNATATNQAATAVNQNTGGGQAHNNVQPYLVVKMWKRVG